MLTQGKGEKTDQCETKSNPSGDFHLTPLGVSRKQFAMFRHDQTEPNIDKQKTDLLTSGAIRVYLIQDAVENKTGISTMKRFGSSVPSARQALRPGPQRRKQAIASQECL